jgi:hypothetical protein
MKFRQQDLTQSVSAAKTGISERSARRIEKNPTGTRAPRRWRKRKDPFDAIWSTILEPMLIEEPTLTGLTLWEYLDDNYCPLKNNRSNSVMLNCTHVGRP